MKDPNLYQICFSSFNSQNLSYESVKILQRYVPWPRLLA